MMVIGRHRGKGMGRRKRREALNKWGYEHPSLPPGNFVLPSRGWFVTGYPKPGKDRMRGSRHSPYSEYKGHHFGILRGRWFK